MFEKEQDPTVLIICFIDDRVYSSVLCSLEQTHRARM